MAAQKPGRYNRSTRFPASCTSRALCPKLYPGLEAILPWTLQQLCVFCCQPTRKGSGKEARVKSSSFPPTRVCLSGLVNPLCLVFEV